MRKFKWNKNGVCKNPRKKKFKKKKAYSILIETAAKNGKWGYGYIVSTNYLNWHGGGYGVWERETQYPTEKEAQAAAIQRLKEHFFNRDHRHDRSARSELNQFLTPQLKLF